MPGNYGFGFYDQEYILPTTPAATQSDPEYPVSRVQRWPRLFPFEDGELLSKCNDFKRGVNARSEKHAQATQ